jgi:hypothetical protein
VRLDRSVLAAAVRSRVRIVGVTMALRALSLDEFIRKRMNTTERTE